MTDRTSPFRPMRELLAQLQRLPATSFSGADLRACDGTSLAAVAEDAETTVSTIHQGLGAIGHLLAHSAVTIEDGTIGKEIVFESGRLP